MRITLSSIEVGLLTPAHRRAMGITSGPTTVEINTLPIDLLKALAKATKSKLTAKAIQAFIQAYRGADARASGAEMMAHLMTMYLAAQPLRFYTLRGDMVYAVVIDDVTFQPAKSGSYPSPPTVMATLNWMLWGLPRYRDVSWNDKHCRGKTPQQLLTELMLTPETPQLRKAYLESRRQYLEYVNCIGRQVRLQGVGYSAADGHIPDVFRDRPVQLDIRGESVQAVVDHCDGDLHLDGHQPSNCFEYYAFDRDQIRGGVLNLEETHKGIPEVPEDPDALTAAAQEKFESRLLPIHPLLPVFDLVRHRFIAAPVSGVTPYVYRKSMVKQLVIPTAHKAMLAVLVRDKLSGFGDIVDGKSGGKTILLAGKPGLGKTLAAEVFSEITERPLYRVQCAQLGVEPEALETQLNMVFDRAYRWNAVVLLDEADLYISRRSNDLVHNAIVCVFLRVLEYQNTLLFLTTNRPGEVDDAVISRCIASLDMATPGPKRLRRIWEVLVDAAGANIPEDVFLEMASRYPDMGGRDVKMAVKLAMCRHDRGANPITLKDMQHTIRFHPNRESWASLHSEERAEELEE